MENVLLVAYLLIVLALIAVILIQRSEGGGLGMGSANSNGLISVRGQANQPIAARSCHLPTGVTSA